MKISSCICNHQVRKADWLRPVVDLVYDAAVNEDMWTSIAPAIAKALNSPSAVFKTCGGEWGPQLESVTDNLRITSSNRSWNEYWHQNDLWVERASRLKLGDVFTNQRLMPDAQFERTAFYQDWTRKLDVYHMVGVIFPVGLGEIGVLGAHRPKDAAAFEAAELRKLSVLFPHMRRALDRRLARLARDATQTGGAEFRLPDAALSIARPGRLPITLLVSPWRPEWAPADVGHPAAMIFIRDPEESAPTAIRTLVEMFGMTKAEAIIALAIGEGKSLEHVAGTQGVGLGTVRTHLKKALSKTGSAPSSAAASTRHAPDRRWWCEWSGRRSRERRVRSRGRWPIG